MSYQGTETCRFRFEVRNVLKKRETKFLSSHGNLPFWFLKLKIKEHNNK